MQLHRLFIATALILTLSAPAFAASKGSSFKCWTNKEGVRECGNEVPPEYAQGQTSTVNSKGITTKVDARAKTAAEVEQEQRQKEEAATRAAEEKRKHDKQAAYDRVLLDSYLKEEEIVAARDRKLSAIDASVELTNSTIAKLEQKLKKEEQLAENQKKAGKQPGAADSNDLESLKKQIDSRKAYVTTRQEERKAIETEYEAYLNRFRELKAAKAPQ
ncbi:MAG TPA: hypothetical protein VGE00_02700 [Gammaproteobacteria bacterium]